MALGRRGGERQDEFWIPTASVARGPGHPFYAKLNELLAEAGFDRWKSGTATHLGVLETAIRWPCARATNNLAARLSGRVYRTDANMTPTVPSSVTMCRWMLVVAMLGRRAWGR